VTDDAEVPLRLDPFDMTSRARAAYADGRPPLPRVADWPIFPFENEGLEVRPVEDPVLPEPPRRGEHAGDCSTCATPDSSFVWTNETWLVGLPAQPAVLPSVVLHPRQHLDLHDLTEARGAEMGVLLVRIQRSLAAIEGVGRVHIYKWGDGGAHLHVLVAARPAGMMQLRGLFLSTWMDILPPLDPHLWQASGPTSEGRWPSPSRRSAEQRHLRPPHGPQRRSAPRAARARLSPVTRPADPDSGVLAAADRGARSGP
jgi:diadenosine tetraphosphate (Ap4A) HIT family hydrolase